VIEHLSAFEKNFDCKLSTDKKYQELLLLKIGHGIDISLNGSA